MRAQGDGRAGQAQAPQGQPAPQPQAPAPADGAQPATPAQPTFRVEANFVRVDVYPTGAKGEPIADLTADGPSGGKIAIAV